MLILVFHVEATAMMCFGLCSVSKFTPSQKFYVCRAFSMTMALGIVYIGHTKMGITDPLFENLICKPLGLFDCLTLLPLRVQLEGYAVSIYM